MGLMGWRGLSHEVCRTAGVFLFASCSWTLSITSSVVVEEGFLACLQSRMRYRCLSLIFFFFFVAQFSPQKTEGRRGGTGLLYCCGRAATNICNS